jgi:NADH dehydrogenase
MAVSKQESLHRPRVVIVGAGFAGLYCARALGNKPVDVTVVDRRNFHLFVPLLYQVATAALSPADIAQPIRRILSRYKNIEVRMDEATGIDREGRRLLLKSGAALDYDRLVIAAGSDYDYFGHDDWARFAPGLKTLEDAQLVRARLLESFERAEATSDPAERQALITTIIVGGGPTGVEMAGSVAELARHALARDFRHVEPRAARIILIEAGPHILSAFPKKLAVYAERELRRLGVTVWTERTVEAVDATGVVVNGERIAAGTVIWGAGVKAAPVKGWLPAETDRSGRVEVAPDLSVPGLERVYVIGDLARFAAPDGQPLPALAQVASQQGEHLGKALAKNLSSGEAMPAFIFKNRGNTAIVGRNAAVFDFGRWQLKGRIAWLLWAIVHIFLLVGFEKRILVSTQWFWRYLTYQSGARLILPANRDPPAMRL